MAESDSTILAPTASDMHLERSRLLDAFARIEDRLGKVFLKHDEKPCYKMPLGQRIENLRQVISTNGGDNQLDEIFDQLAELNAFRGNIVHAELSELRDEQNVQRFAVFRNAPFDDHQATVIKFEQLKELKKRAFDLANKLQQMLAKKS